jgi:peptidoglycan/LPS O-acetylase OafA/YrhL
MSNITWPEQRSFVSAFDGLRAIAVLLVVWYHVHDVVQPAALGAFTAVARLGWVGVDLFFALSGFLITGILLKTRNSDQYFRNFYVRRVLRIFPLYYGVVTLILVSHALAGRDGDVPVWSLYAFLSNFFVAASGSPDLALAVTWSLSVEEQFYAVWPALVAFLSTRNLRLTCALVAVASPAFRVFLYDPDNLGFYMNTLCRMDALVIGALGAIAWYEHDERLVRASWKLAWPAVATLLGMGAAATWGVADGHPVVAALSFTAVALCTVTILLALASGGMPRLAKALTWEPMAHIGRVSFGVYLLHPLVFTLAGGFWTWLGLEAASSSVALSVAAFALYSFASVAVATFVFEGIERPLLELKDRFAPHNGPARQPTARPARAPAPGLAA